MKKTYKYRLLANEAILGKTTHWLDLCRHLYNAGLEQRIEVYRRNRGRISCYGQINQLPDLKVALPEYRDVGSQVLQDVLERLDLAYQNFFRRVKSGDKAGFPRFRSKDRYDSFTLKQAGWKLDGGYLSVRNLGRFKLRLSRPIEGAIKTVTIRREDSGKWYACFSCAGVPEKRLPESDKIVGIDVGIASFLTDSDGNKVENPRFLLRGEAYLRRCQRAKDRKMKGSHGRQKARIILAKAYEKVHNQRLDFLHKTANHYVKNYGTIAIEDLNIQGMVRNHCLAGSISDSCWGTFFGLLEYKAEEAGRKVIRIPRFDPSSKTCSECGAVNQELKLSDRQWVCKSCRALHDRDHNAAKNIRRVGQTRQALTKESAPCVA